MAHLQATKAFIQKLAAQGRLVTKGNQSGGFIQSFNKITFDYRRFNQYGLFEDDILKETDTVKEALRRLPREVYQERQYRLARAIDVSAKQRCLAKEDWTKYEDDLPYLRTYVSDVLKEEKEREDWDLGNVKL